MSEEQNHAHPVSPNALSPAEERQWGMIAHLAPLVAMVFSAGMAGFVGSLIVYLLYKDRGPFVRAHSANSLNVQITTVLAILAGIVVSLTIIGLIIGIPLIIAAVVGSIVIHVVAAVKANKGEWYSPPFTIKFVS